MKGKGKRYPEEFKRQIVKEVEETGNASLVARRHDLVPGTVTRWVRESKKQNGLIPSSNYSNNINAKSLEEENEQLKKLLGEKDLEIAILRDLLKKNEPTIEDKVNIAKKWIDLGYTAVTVLKIVGLSRSTYYYNIKKRAKSEDVNEDIITNKGGRPIPGYSFDKDGDRICDEQIKEYILEIIETEGLYYGYYKITVLLRRKFNLIINKKKVYRLCKELEILRSQRKIKAKHPRKIAKNREITWPNSLWETDVKYGYIHGEDRFFYITSFLDVYDRNVVEYHIGLSCKTEDIIIALKRALMKRGLYNKETNLVIRSDNGPQFISNKFQDTCKELKLEHERIPFKTPNKNAHIEAFHRLLEDECLSRSEFNSYAEAYEAVSEYIKFYNKTRIHSSLGYISPTEFYYKTLEGTAKSLVVKL